MRPIPERRAGEVLTGARTPSWLEQVDSPRALYGRLGFRVESALPDVGFSVLRKPIGAPLA